MSPILSTSMSYSICSCFLDRHISHCAPLALLMSGSTIALRRSLRRAFPSHHRMMLRDGAVRATGPNLSLSISSSSEISSRRALMIRANWLIR